MTSSLVLCGISIGNPLDIPVRTIDALKSCDFILCEDTRTAGRLLSSLSIGKPLRSYFNYNEQKRVDELRKELQTKTLRIALISETGMPLIADPGYRVVNLFHELGLKVEAIGGPTAFVMALVMSGFPLNQFSFLGFWPTKTKDRKQAISLAESGQHPVSFYESPMRIVKTLRWLAAASPDLQVFVVKELTKTYETSWRGQAEDVATQIENSTVKGEFTVVAYCSSK